MLSTAHTTTPDHFYIPAEYKAKPVGTVIYHIDGFYEICEDGYIYKE